MALQFDKATLLTLVHHLAFFGQNRIWWFQCCSRYHDCSDFTVSHISWQHVIWLDPEEFFWKQWNKNLPGYLPVSSRMASDRWGWTWSSWRNDPSSSLQFTTSLRFLAWCSHSWPIAPPLSTNGNDHCSMWKANNKQFDCWTMQNTCYVTLGGKESGSAQYRAAPLGFIENRQCFSQAITPPLFPHSGPRSTPEPSNRGFHFKELEQSRWPWFGASGGGGCVAELSGSRSAGDSGQVSHGGGCRGRNGSRR